MGRSTIATLASLILLCAALFGAASVLRGVSAPAPLPVSLMALVNTDDGISLDESVIDDLRPTAQQDAPASPFSADQLPPSARPAWRMAGCSQRWTCPGTQPLLPWPYLGSPLRPPSAA